MAVKDENKLQIISGLKLILLAVFATLYGFGGIKGKWKRRIIGSGVMTVGIIGFSLWQGSFSYWYLAYWPLLWGALSIGYGVKDFKVSWMKWANKPEIRKKIVKRTYYGIAGATAALPMIVVNGAWLMYFLHLSLCVIVSIVLGVLNPIDAREEETLIGTVLGLLPIYMI